MEPGSTPTNWFGFTYWTALVTNHRTPFVLLAVAAVAGFILAALTPLNRVGVHQASNVT
jgi:hypothetical protein